MEIPTGEEGKRADEDRDQDRACAGTPAAELERQITDPMVPKNEREHWASNEIHRLRDQLYGGCSMHPVSREVHRDQIASTVVRAVRGELSAEDRLRLLSAPDQKAAFLEFVMLQATIDLRTGGGPFYRDSQNIPSEIKASIDAHVMTGKPAGSFLQAVLENDLKTAVMKADESNYLLFGAILGYCCNEIPVICWGSEDAVAAWQRKGGWLAVYPGEPVRLKGLVVK